MPQDVPPFQSPAGRTTSAGQTYSAKRAQQKRTPVSNKVAPTLEDREGKDNFADENTPPPDEDPASEADEENLVKAKSKPLAGSAKTRKPLLAKQPSSSKSSPVGSAAKSSKVPRTKATAKSTVNPKPNASLAEMDENASEDHEMDDLGHELDEGKKSKANLKATSTPKLNSKSIKPTIGAKSVAAKKTPSNKSIGDESEKTSTVHGKKMSSSKPVKQTESSHEEDASGPEAEEEDAPVVTSKSGPEKKSLGGIFSEVVAVVQVQTDDAIEAGKEFENKIKSFGGKILQNWGKSATHLIFRDGKKTAFEKASEAGCPVVSPMWISECVKQGKLVPVDDYRANLGTNLLASGKRRKSMEPRLSLSAKRAKNSDDLSDTEDINTITSESKLAPATPTAAVARKQVRKSIGGAPSAGSSNKSILPTPKMTPADRKANSAPASLKGKSALEPKTPVAKSKVMLNKTPGSLVPSKSTSLLKSKGSIGKSVKAIADTKKPITPKNKPSAKEQKNGRKSRKASESGDEMESDDETDENMNGESDDEEDDDDVNSEDEEEEEDDEDQRLPAKSSKMGHETPVTAPRQKIVHTIVGTNLDASGHDLLHTMVKHLGEARVLSSVSPGKTTVVVSGDSVRRTLSVLIGLASGCFVVGQEWIMRSLEANKWLDPADYQLPAFPSQRRRLDDPKPLNGVSILLGKTMAPRLEMEKICNMMGLSQSPLAEILISCETPRRVCRAQVVQERWLFDCVANWSSLPIDAYVTNPVSDEATIENEVLDGGSTTLGEEATF